MHWHELELAGRTSSKRHVVGLLVRGQKWKRGLLSQRFHPMTGQGA